MNVPVITLELNNWSLGPLAVLSARGGNETEFSKINVWIPLWEIPPRHMFCIGISEVSTPAASQSALRVACVRSLALSCSLAVAGPFVPVSHGGRFACQFSHGGILPSPPPPPPYWVWSILPGRSPVWETCPMVGGAEAIYAHGTSLNHQK